MFVDTSIQLYFYPRPPRGGRPHIVGLPSKNRVISIHALREEGDYGRFSQLVKVIKFLSTPSARRATLRARTRARDQLISIHALREEGDEPRSPPARCTPDFYPRPPRGGRRLSQRHAVNLAGISIHALREEGDAVRGRSTARCSNFYPRPPRGGRHFRLVDVAPSCIFLSTPSARRATTPTLGFAT